ncbi:MAG TPA: hypothetical protein VIF09_26095 [Polyangiaceae bacterium]
MSSLDALGLDVDEGGVCLRALGLWLDPTRSVPAAFVSHAHAAAAAGGSGRAIATPETLAVAAAVGVPLEDAAALGWGDAMDMPVEPAFGGGTARLSLAPAGHALGAAQLLIEYRDARLLYTGDWSAEADATHPAGAVVACDDLVLTSAFALPIFRFAPASEVRTALVEWCRGRLAGGVTPVVLARTPGPAQAVVHALSAGGLPVSGDEEVRRACAAYEALGVVLGPVAPRERGEKGRVVVASTGAKATEVRARGKTEVAYASGWAELDAAVEQKRADAAFVLADQPDLDGLLALVRSTSATRVFAARGDAAPLAHLLRATGVEARSLGLDPIDERGQS